MTTELAVLLENIVKTYTLHHEKPTLVEHLINSSRESFNALKKINLKIKKGEKVGIIGSNGSGKTTLLKIIARITAHNSGSVAVSGNVVSLIDLEAGFHPDLTGEENIYLNGLLLGVRKQEIRDKFRAILEFADIDKFIDTPLFTYSEGMKLRLGFSIAVHANPDILILDEAISVGDENFQKKSKGKIQEFFRQGKTIIICTHWLEFIEENCERVIWMENGTIKKDGTTEIIKEYRKSIQRQTNAHSRFIRHS